MKKISILSAICALTLFLCACGETAIPEREAIGPLASLKEAAKYTDTATDAKTPDSTAEDTTAAPVTIHVEETTTAPETIAPPPEETTAKPVTTTPPAKVTTAAPVTTVPVTETTAKETTAAPVTTVPVTETTAKETTTAPVTTVPVTETTTAKETTTAPVTEPVTTQAETTAAESTTAAPVTTIPVTETTAAETTTSETTPAVPAPEELLDFDVLREVNEDIYAWLEIEGTIMDDPILQNAKDDTKYLNTSYDKKKSTAGALYTEATYNSRDFNDPVTLIYGHKTIKGHMFGALQPTYSDAKSFAEHSDIKIYLPGEVRHYTVFAAVPYDNTHILYTYDFTNKYWYRNFFKGVKNVRAIGANLNEDAFPEPGDRVIILSACHEGDRNRRYLVMAVLREDLADNVGEGS